MEFSKGQPVVILSIDCKPIGNAIVESYDPGSYQYKVHYQYSNTNESETIEVPGDRLVGGTVKKKPDVSSLLDQLETQFSLKNTERLL